MANPSLPTQQTPPTPAVPVGQRQRMASGGNPVGTSKKTPA